MFSVIFRFRYLQVAGTQKKKSSLAGGRQYLFAEKFYEFRAVLM